ncbi:MAG: hypothetical protein AAF471_08060, partial [Myxococcota bacterium]
TPHPPPPPRALRRPLRPGRGGGGMGETLRSSGLLSQAKEYAECGTRLLFHHSYAFADTSPTRA